jgi:hypothetical protein
MVSLSVLTRYIEDPVDKDIAMKLYFLTHTGLYNILRT